MGWFLSAILSLTLAPAPAAEEVDEPLPVVAESPAANFWVLDTPYSGHWEYRERALYLISWDTNEWGELVPTFTPCTVEEALAAEQMREEYGG